MFGERHYPCDFYTACYNDSASFLVIALTCMVHVWLNFTVGLSVWKTVLQKGLGPRCDFLHLLESQEFGCLTHLSFQFFKFSTCDSISYFSCFHDIFLHRCAGFT